MYRKAKVHNPLKYTGGHQNTFLTNTDQGNKALNRIETHDTNSILVQKYDLGENFSNMSLDAD